MTEKLLTGTLSLNTNKNKTATGECSPFYGKAQIEFTLGNQKLSHEILFADIKNDGILIFNWH